MDIDNVTDEDLGQFLNEVKELSNDIKMGKKARALAFNGGSKNGMELCVLCNDGFPKRFETWLPISISFEFDSWLPCELYRYEIKNDAFEFTGEIDVKFFDNPV